MTEDEDPLPPEFPPIRYETDGGGALSAGLFMLLMFVFIIALFLANR